MNTLAKIVLSSVIAIISGMISWYFGIEKAFNLIISLLFFIVTMHVIETASSSVSLKEIEKSNNLMLQTIKSLFKNGTAFSDFYNAILLSDLRVKLKKSEIVVPSEEVLSFWSELNTHFDKSFFATSYIALDEGWTLAYIETSLTVQEEKIKHGKHVKRVFIIDTEDELEKVIPIIGKQRARGIDAKYIFHDAIQKHRPLSKIKLESLDFILIDNEFLTICVLDKKRKITCLRLTPDRKKLEKYRNFYDLLFSEAKVPAK